jgi:pimeloyl-ACP methyl ester carboxylesterase
MLAELPRTALTCAKLPFQTASLAAAPRGQNDPVLVLPGFAASDSSTAMLRSYLRWLGHDVYRWDLGRNLGAKTVGLHNEVLVEKLEAIHAARGRNVAVVGWSMGGIMARLIARARPHMVSQLILLGAPFTGDPYANRAWWVYEKLTGHSLSHPVARAQMAASKLPPPVPSTSIYSRSDGVAAWQCCLEPPTASTRNIEVDCAHCAFGFDARVLRTVADVLASPK